MTRRKLDLGTELQKIYDSKINVGFSWLWDGGIDVRLGDSVNGYLAEAIVPSVADSLPWLQEAIAHFYPESTYAKGLSAEVKARAACRIFLPPTNGATCNVSALRSPQP